ncbi:hypothetical protein ACX80V_05405 [Arthrobacter sp. MDT3-24]
MQEVTNFSEVLGIDVAVTMAAEAGKLQPLRSPERLANLSK